MDLIPLLFLFIQKRSESLKDDSEFKLGNAKNKSIIEKVKLRGIIYFKTKKIQI